MVTAAGEKVVAGPDGDPDLLWALRGGGGNFGVVTAFEFEAIDPGPILAGYIHYPISAVKQVLRQLASLAESAPGALELTAQIGPHEEVVAGLSVRVGVCWPGDIAVGTDILRPLRAACPAISDTVGPMEYPAIQAMSGRLAFGLRHYWKGHFLRALDESIIAAIVDAMEARPASPASSCSRRSVARHMSSPRAARRSDSERRRGTRVLSGSGMTRRSTTASSPGRERRPTVWRTGSLTGAGYANYAPVDEPIERVRLAFGTERFARLAAIKARYDPDNRFRFNLNIAPG